MSGNLCIKGTKIVPGESPTGAHNACSSSHPNPQTNKAKQKHGSLISSQVAQAKVKAAHKLDCFFHAMHNNDIGNMSLYGNATKRLKLP